MIGKLISTDTAGNNYYRLYMHVGANPNSIDLTPGATNGVLYDGMSSDGTMVYFTAKDALTPPPIKTPTPAPTSTEPMSVPQAPP